VDQTNAFDKPTIIEYLETEEQVKIDWLYAHADKLRKRYMGDEIHIRGIIEFSNHCRRDCLYCGLRRSNPQVVRYRMETDEILKSAEIARGLGYRTVVLQCGEDKGFSVDQICAIIRDIKTKYDLAITLSLGELSREEYARLKDAGADRYLMRFETTDRALFQRLKPNCDYDHRFEILDWLRGLGYQVGSGIMIGLPGQTVVSIAEDILKFQELNLDMIGNGPFIANPQTPLSGQGGGTVTQALKLVALTRIVTKDAHIPATTALGTIDPQGRQKALQCGANVFMPNVTPKKYREHYLLYPNKICIGEEPSDCGQCVKDMIESLGRTIGQGHGHSLKVKS